MNVRDLWILVPSVVFPLWITHPFLLGPLTVSLLIKPMILASETISILTDSSSSAQLGYKVPEYWNDCLEDSSQIPSQVETRSLDTEVRKLRAFLACGIIFTIFTGFSIISWCVLLCCRKPNDDDYEKVPDDDKTPDPEAKFYADGTKQ